MNLSKPPVRDSRIPCPNCKKGTLFWNSEEKLYVCTKCGVQEPALKTWISAAEHRHRKKQQKHDNERQWALNILGVKDGLVPPQKSKREQEWEEIIDLVKKKESKR
ncbi:MAG: TFIIB-type zinc finger domain-containing protein [Candidatus Heimdallarchaeota archaeon]|nr:MAG: TFIIB-type zinc finger domain-containing protein [Candidatus Heimdallarchaeota archaeon]